VPRADEPMRLASFHRSDGTLGTGVATPSGEIVDLQAAERDFPSDMNALLGSPRLLERAQRLGEHPPLRAVRAPEACAFAPAVPRPARFLLCGRNYREHVAEMGFEPPQKPAVFARFAATLIGAGEPILVSPTDRKVDWEGELVAVVGRKGKYIPRSEAMKHVVGLTCFNDVSMRELQKTLPHVTIGKNFDASGPLGPWVVTMDEVPDVTNLTLTTRVNGELVQEANTRDLIFDIPYLIELISSAMTLEPGDLISTGSPSGVGHARKPPRYLKHGDTVTVSVEGIGALTNPVRDEPTTRPER
jgi:2-keto-4-pentenoate hydratase/2-oxohepta-3-ene-1,7-dioic acid hydratase in catechol pathway